MESVCEYNDLKFLPDFYMLNPLIFVLLNNEHINNSCVTMSRVKYSGVDSSRKPRSSHSPDPILLRYTHCGPKTAWFLIAISGAIEHVLVDGTVLHEGACTALPFVQLYVEPKGAERRSGESEFMQLEKIDWCIEKKKKRAGWFIRQCPAPCPAGMSHSHVLLACSLSCLNVPVSRSARLFSRHHLPAQVQYNLPVRVPLCLPDSAGELLGPSCHRE